MKPFTYTFLGGRRIHKTIAATAGNVQTDLTPGAGKRWLVIGGHIRLVNDGNAANRQIMLKVMNALVDSRAIGATTAITAGQTRDLDFGEGRAAQTAALGNPSYGQFYLGIAPTLVDGTDIFNVTILAGLAGDSYSGDITLLEIDI